MHEENVAKLKEEMTMLKESINSICTEGGKDWMSHESTKSLERLLSALWDYENEILADSLIASTPKTDAA